MAVKDKQLEDLQNVFGLFCDNMLRQTQELRDNINTIERHIRLSKLAYGKEEDEG